MEQGDPILTGRRLSFGYNHRAVLQGLSFDVRRGDILGIVGPNGSGKTTLLRTMLGLLKPLQGQVERRAGLTIGYVPRRDRIDTILPHGARSGAHGTLRPGRAFRARAPCDHDAGLRTLGLLGAEPLGRQFHELVWRQQQRVLLARRSPPTTPTCSFLKPTAGSTQPQGGHLDFLRI